MFGSSQTKLDDPILKAARCWSLDLTHDWLGHKQAVHQSALMMVHCRHVQDQNLSFLSFKQTTGTRRWLQFSKNLTRKDSVKTAKTGVSLLFVSKYTMFVLSGETEVTRIFFFFFFFFRKRVVARDRRAEKEGRRSISWCFFSLLSSTPPPHNLFSSSF